MKILAIETSCDETSAAVLEQDSTGKIIVYSNVLATSLALHSVTGGIIPEIAAREQVKFIIPVIEEALAAASVIPSEQSESRDPLEISRQARNDILRTPNIDAIAVTYGPGLIGSLLVGVETAKTLSLLWDKPLIPVNHLYGHLYANFISENSKPETRNPKQTQNINDPMSKTVIARSETTKQSLKDRHAVARDDDILFPAIGLIVSGGHTDLVYMKDTTTLEWLGGTRDDAAGECFDKCARLLGYDYPGGPKISKLAEKGNPKAYVLPRPMHDSKDYDFSFSGLKTAFLNLLQKHFEINRKDVPNTKAGWQQIKLEDELSEEKKQQLYDLCASLQAAITDSIVKKTVLAGKNFGVKSVLMSGGVAANTYLRQELERSLAEQNIKLYAPEIKHCMDNAAMIGAAALMHPEFVSWENVTANPELYFD